MQFPNWIKIDRKEKKKTREKSRRGTPWDRDRKAIEAIEGRLQHRERRKHQRRRRRKSCQEQQRTGRECWGRKWRRERQQHGGQRRAWWRTASWCDFQWSGSWCLSRPSAWRRHRRPSTERRARRKAWESQKKLRLASSQSRERYWDGEWRRGHSRENPSELWEQQGKPPMEFWWEKEFPFFSFLF